MAEIFTLFYDYQIRLNLYHFQTNSYAGHKASDAHLAKFKIHFDRFLALSFLYHLYHLSTYYKFVYEMI